MVDAEMTHLLSEMRLTHLAGELEKATTQKVDEIPLFDKEESSAEMRLNRQVAEANRLLGVKRRKKIVFIAMILAIVGGVFGYFFMQEAEVSTVIVKQAPKKRVYRTYKTNTKRLRQLFLERKRALDAVSKEITRLIHAHGRKKQERFASRLMALSSKCQALDEQYTRQIVYETKLLSQSKK